MSSSRLIQVAVIGLQMLICCGLCPPPSSTEVREVIAQTTLNLKAAVASEIANLCASSDSCDGADTLLNNLTRQHTEILKFQVKDKLNHNCTDSSVNQTTENAEANLESAEATTESAEATTESADATTKSAEATTESAEATTESAEATPAEPSQNAVIERTIQRRISDSVDFDRDWDDYVTGFGEEDGNYWMGLEDIHQLTTIHNVSLFIDIETFEGEPFTLKLETFCVGNATTNYTIHSSGYSQSSDRLKNTAFVSFHNGMMFSTRDRDNDLWSRNCASDSRRGGWWYHSCGYINLNGNYEGDVTPTRTGIIVPYIDTTSSSITATKAVKSVEMIIRTRVE